MESSGLLGVASEHAAQERDNAITETEEKQQMNNPGKVTMRSDPLRCLRRRRHGVWDKEYAERILTHRMELRGELKGLGHHLSGPQSLPP